MSESGWNNGSFLIINQLSKWQVKNSLRFDIYDNIYRKKKHPQVNLHV